jgi:hypothetical protein
VRRLVVTIAFLGALAAGCGKSGDTSADSTTTTSTSTTAVTTPHALIPADSATPAAGTCADGVGGIVTITLNPDVPSPRCTIVYASDQLKFVNNTDQLQTVDTGYGQVSLHPHASHVFPQKVGDYWAKGVHRPNTTLYGASDPEIWLQ